MPEDTPGRSTPEGALCAIDEPWQCRSAEEALTVMQVDRMPG